jgi:hypothetical protein
MLVSPLGNSRNEQMNFLYFKMEFEESFRTNKYISTYFDRYDRKRDQRRKK